MQAAQIAAARDVAAKAGLTIESRNTQASLTAISTTASGATSITRHTLTATTAGALALLGAVIGTAAAYLALD